MIALLPSQLALKLGSSDSIPLVPQTSSNLLVAKTCGHCSVLILTGQLRRTVITSSIFTYFLNLVAKYHALFMTTSPGLCCHPLSRLPQTTEPLLTSFLLPGSPHLLALLIYLFLSLADLSCSLWVLYCGAGLSCPVACRILVPQPGTESLSPALQGRFLTTGLPGKSILPLLSPTCDSS